MGEAKPNYGGCWFCHKDTPPLVFSFEFDTNLHLRCLKEAWSKRKELNKVARGELDIFEAEFRKELKNG